ncbi:MAG: hypothetical protein V1854_03490 [Methanobacteriota archaeon]
MVDYQKQELTETEDALFEAQWDKFLTRHFRAREVIDVFQDHKDIIKEAARVAKYQLESPFGGANAETNQFGWMPILPNFLLTASGSTPTYSTATWRKYITTTNVTSRWIDLWGSSATNLKLTKYGTMIVVGFIDPVDVPKIGALLAKIKGKDYPVWDFGDSMLGTDYPIYELIEPFIVEKEQEFYIQARADRAGVSELRPIGVFYAKGDYMRKKDAAATV